MKRLMELALKTDKEAHLDIFPILYFAKSLRKLLFFAYFYDKNQENYCDYYIKTKNALTTFVKEEDVDRIFEDLADIRIMLDEDVEAMIKSDPINPTKQEVILCYPGFEAITYYRIAHLIYKLDYKLVARVISEYAHRKTQVDIHPGATIGHRFCIDHATGVVIGETTIIEDDVRIYQGVTLGAKSLNDASKVIGTKRHPTIRSGVIIYANATILGGDTVIEKNSIVKANDFIVR